jgi:short-subunit dehydrogenase
MATTSKKPYAVVTGASSGIGYELAKVFAEEGHDLLVVAEDAEIERAAGELRALGAAVEAMQADLATHEGVERLADRLEAAGRPIDAIALNAGVGVGGGFLDTDLQEELDLIALNVTGVVHLAKRVLPAMVARGEGKVLFTSSIAATMPGPFMAVYAASKAFVQSFAEALRNEVKDSGVTITSLQPGPTETHFFDRAHMEDTKVAQDPKDDPAVVARDGYDAMMAGKDHVVAGAMKNKLQVMMNRVTPEPMKAQAHRKLAEPGSGDE